MNGTVLPKKMFTAINSSNHPPNTTLTSTKLHPFPTKLSAFLLLAATIVTDSEGVPTVGPGMTVISVGDIGKKLGIGSVGIASSKIPAHWGILLKGINGSDVVVLRSAFAVLFHAASH